MLEVLWWREIAGFFMHFTNDAIQECLLALTVAAEQSNLARIEDVRIVIAPLKEEATVQVDEYGAGHLTMFGSSHEARSNSL
jgi:hypothetical protein